MSDQAFDVVVIGGGQAGLSVSYLLTQHGMRHIVLERGSIGESWRAQRWDSFMLNTPNKFNVLPGDAYNGTHPEGFESAKNFVSYLEEYARRYRLPVQEHARVLAVERHAPLYDVTAEVNGLTTKYACRQVVVASGGMNELKIPSFANNISSTIMQYHAGRYRSPSQLPDGGVLVVGSAQSGLQVAEDLVDAGRSVYISTSAVGRVPRRYRGKDILDWLLMLGFYDVKTDDVAGTKELEMRQPQVSGVGPLGHTLSLQSLAKRGAVVLGKIESASGSVLNIQPNVKDHVKFGDEVSGKIKGLIEQYIAEHHLHVPPAEPDPADEADTECVSASSIRSLELEKEGIRSVVWATGFSGDFSYLRGVGVDANGRPAHRNGVSDVAGLYFLGLPWLRKRKSGIIPGIAEDAMFIAERVRLASAG